MPTRFRVDAPFKPAGDQPQAIEHLVEGVQGGLSQQVLLGVTGSGKTNVMAWAVEQLQRPVLVLSPNKTLAAQLCAEFRRLLPGNAVEYFVSYYDYYQPEAYIARTDTYIEKDSSRNDDIDRMRHSTTQSLLTRRDVLVVASVSCIYGIGSAEDYMGESLHVEKGHSIRRVVFLRELTEMLYERNDYDLARLRFRVRGDVVDLVPANEEKVYRVEFFGDEVDRIQELDAVTGEILGAREQFTVFPASHYVTPADKLRLAMADIEVELEERCRWFEDHRHLRGDRELLDASHAPQAWRDPLHVDGLLARRHADLRRRVARRRAADRRHARRRPFPQGRARRVRLPPAQRLRQPPPELRGVGGAGAERHLRLGDARPVRDAAFAAHGRDARPADRTGRSDRRGAADGRPDRRPARRGPQEDRAGTALAGDDADQAVRGRPGRLPARVRRQGPLPAFGAGCHAAHRGPDRTSQRRGRRGG